MLWPNFDDSYETAIVTWETKAAKFIQIEISPFHIFRIKIDKVISKQKKEVG